MPRGTVRPVPRRLIVVPKEAVRDLTAAVALDVDGAGVAGAFRLRAEAYRRSGEPDKALADDEAAERSGVRTRRPPPNQAS